MAVVTRVRISEPTLFLFILFIYSNKNNKISFFMKSFITITRNNVNLTFNKYNIFESKIIYLFKAIIGKNIYFLITKQNKMIFFKIKT